MTPGELTRRTPLPRHESERLLALAMGLPRHKALTRSAVPGPILARYRKLVARRRGGEPLQYIEGSVPFGPIEVAVDPRVLIPRPETEQLFALVAEWDDPQVIVDMCTGSGCLGIALAKVFPSADVQLADISSDALEVAAANAGRNGVVASTWQGDCFDALPEDLRGRVDCFVANPPYVTDAALETLDCQVREHEPVLALGGGADGLDTLREIASGLPEWLAADGGFGIEIGHDQGPAAAALFGPLGAEILQDAFGNDRFVVRRPTG